MTIRLVHGSEQRFRFRCPDITIRGLIEDRKMPIVAAGVTLNGSASRPLYVEQDPDAGLDWVHAYKATPAELRCREQGEFCIEIAAIDPALREGSNDLQIWARDSSGQRETKTLHFHWDPIPCPYRSICAT